MILILGKLVVKYAFLCIKTGFLSTKYEFQGSKYVDKSNIWGRNVNIANNQGKSIDQLFDLVLIPNCMSSIGVGIQKLAIHSQLIGLKTCLLYTSDAADE